MNVRAIWHAAREDARIDVGYIQMSVLGGYYEYLVDDTDEYGYPTNEGLDRARRFALRAENWTNFGWWLYEMVHFWRYFVEMIVSVAICARFDHDWECEDWATPETGGMAATCKRCGFSFHHTMY